MTQFMTPSVERTMTEGQVAKAVANFRAQLEKHASEFDSRAVQSVLGQPEFAEEQLAVFRRRVDAVSILIFRRVKVNRGRSPQDVLGGGSIPIARSWTPCLVAKAKKSSSDFSSST